MGWSAAASLKRDREGAALDIGLHMLKEAGVQGVRVDVWWGICERAGAGQLRARLVDPAKSNPNTIMPAYFKVEDLQRVAPQFAGKTVLTGQEIEDVIAYLLTIQRP